VSRDIQRSFAAGEITPSLYARHDLTKYQTALALCRNFFVRRYGGVSNRSGTQKVGEYDPNSNSKTFKFFFNAEESYAVIFTPLTITFEFRGEKVTLAAREITALTNANPAVVTVPSHGYASGDEVIIRGCGGMSEINDREFVIANVTTDTFELQALHDGAAINSSDYGVYTFTGTVEKVYKVASPYTSEQIPTLYAYAQSADVITVTHHKHKVKELSRLAHTNWTLTDVAFEPSISPPHGATIATSGTGSTVRYRVTAVTKDAEESLHGRGATSYAISNVTVAAGVVTVTATGHTFINGEEVFLSGIVGPTALNDKTFAITGVAANVFNLVDFDGTGLPAYVSGGTATFDSPTAYNTDTGTNKTLTIPAVTGAFEYNIYKQTVLTGSVFGLVGVARAYGGAITFVDQAFIPNTAIQPPEKNTPFETEGNFPQVSGYASQRRFFGNTENEPERVWGTRVGQYTNLCPKGQVITDNNPLEFVLNVNQVNEIRHFIENGRLLVLTSGGEHAFFGDASGKIGPFSLGQRQFSAYGSSSVAPVAAGANVLFIEGRTGLVQDIVWSDDRAGFAPVDRSIFAAHLFENHSIVAAAFQRVPDSILWCVRDDGILVGMTYLTEHEIAGWHQSVTDGRILDVCVVPEEKEDTVYLMVERTINGQTRKFHEKLARRNVSEVEDYVFVDCSVTIDGRNTEPSKQFGIFGGTDWGHEELLSLMPYDASVRVSAEDVGATFRLTGADGQSVRIEVTEYVSAIIPYLKGFPDETVPTSLQGVNTATWERAIKTVKNLHHLEGKAVSALGDGGVLADALVDDEPIVVTNGRVDLPQAAAVLHIGLPFIADMKTLDIERLNGETVVGKRKNIGAVTAKVEESRGLYAGQDEPVGDDPLQDLYEWKPEGFDLGNEPTTGEAEIEIKSTWSTGGQVFIRQVSPLPITILAISPVGLVG
jgi:hypothetical protein